MNSHYESSSDDDDVPETVSLRRSKQIVEDEASTLQQAQSADRQKKREKNRVRDQKLKGQAAAKKGKQRPLEEEDEEDAVTIRMRRAMQDAERESDEEDVDMDDNESSDSEVSFHGFDVPSSSKNNPNYLPDHLFTSAFASQSKSTSSKAKQNKEIQKGKKKARSKPKDLIVGSRTIRSLAESSKPGATTAMAPSRKINKFLDRTLALKTGKAKARGWERRPASIGSLKTSGPAAHFIRS